MLVVNKRPGGTTARGLKVPESYYIYLTKEDFLAFKKDGLAPKEYKDINKKSRYFLPVKLTPYLREHEDEFLGRDIEDEIEMKLYEHNYAGRKIKVLYICHPYDLEHAYRKMRLEELERKEKR